MKKELQKLMDKYGLTIKDLPAFIKPGTDLKGLIIMLGEEKTFKDNKWYRPKMKGFVY